MSKVVKEYKIHDNRGRPFLVHVNGLNIKIFTRNDVEDNYSYLMDYKVVNTFVGRSRQETTRDVYDGKYEYTGNSILLEIEKKLNINRYVYIGHEIYEFTTDEPIIRYYSLIGNNDVPYPVAISETYAYFFLDKKYVPKCLFPNNIHWINAYSKFYAHTIRNRDKNIKRFNPSNVKKMDTILIHKRIWPLRNVNYIEQ